MVFEEFITSDSNPSWWKVFVFGFIYATVGLFLAVQVFKSWASLVMVFLTVLACVPLFYSITVREERNVLVSNSEISLLRRHRTIIILFVVLFLGMLSAFAFWYYVLPNSSSFFSLQQQTIGDMNSKISSEAVTGRASASSGKIFGLILLNNVRVLLSAIVFSLLYGTGALFILTWNASVLGVAMGSFAKQHFAVFGAKFGTAVGTGVLYAGTITVLRFWIHGIPEMAGYFVGGLAGGILSVAIMHHDISTKNFEKISLDVAALLLWALGILVVSAGIEVYITPLIVTGAVAVIT